MRFTKPKIWAVFLTIATVVGFCRLGLWQLDRADHKRLVATSLSQAESFPPLSTLRRLEAATPYRSVTIHGTFHQEQQLLLDNQVLHGNAGYEVITPLLQANGELYLVNRGWVAGNPTSLPSWSTPSGEVVLRGVIAPHAAAGMRMGEAVVAAADTQSGWPKVVNYPSLEELELLLALPIAPYTLWLDADAPHGFARDWQPQELTVEKHLGYAFQWFALALAVFVLFIVLHVKRND